jgi:hypothetical protein
VEAIRRGGGEDEIGAILEMIERDRIGLGRASTDVARNPRQGPFCVGRPSRRSPGSSLARLATELLPARSTRGCALADYVYDRTVPADDDWRLSNQGEYLLGAELVWRAWPAPVSGNVRAWRLADGAIIESPSPDLSPPEGAVEEVQPHDWDHDHCEFCWAKFMAADFPPEQREWREQHRDILTAGYTLAEPGRRRILDLPDLLRRLPRAVPLGHCGS